MLISMSILGVIAVICLITFFSTTIVVGVQEQDGEEVSVGLIITWFVSLLLIILIVIGFSFTTRTNYPKEYPLHVNSAGTAIYSVDTQGKYTNYSFNINNHPEFNNMQPTKIVYNTDDNQYIEATTSTFYVLPFVRVVDNTSRVVVYLNK